MRSSAGRPYEGERICNAVPAHRCLVAVRGGDERSRPGDSRSLSASRQQMVPQRLHLRSDPQGTFFHHHPTVLSGCSANATQAASLAKLIDHGPAITRVVTYPDAFLQLARGNQLPFDRNRRAALRCHMTAVKVTLFPRHATHYSAGVSTGLGPVSVRSKCVSNLGVHVWFRL
jgi:hypothetical protein